MSDNLESIFEYQQTLQELIGETYDQAYINKIVLALMCEMHEVLETTQWKSWKKHQKPFDRKEYLKELVDAQCFLTNLCLAKGITAKEFYMAFLEKNYENIQRQKNNY